MGMREIRVNGLRRVNKKKALNIFKQGAPLYCVPCKLRPTQETVLQLTYNQKHGLCAEDLFTRLVNEATYYNCNSSTGRELWFYELEQ